MFDHWQEIVFKRERLKPLKKKEKKRKKAKPKRGKKDKAQDILLEVQEKAPRPKTNRYVSTRSLTRDQRNQA